MIYGNGEMLDSYLPKPLDGVPDLSYGSQPVSMGHLVQERNKFQRELSQLKDPTYREPFETPVLPAGFQEHETDDSGVEAAGTELVKRLGYVEKQIDSHQIQMAAFLDSVAQRATNEQAYEKALTAAVEAGKDAPAPIVHDDLSGSHAELNRLESAITTGARLAHESRAKLDAAYLDLYASEVYRKWAEKEIGKRTQDAAKALELLRTALGARESVVNNLPDAYADLDGVTYVEPVSRRNNLGFGGMDPYSDGGERAVSLSEALSKVESVTIPGDGIRKWSLSQLDDDEKRDYAKRASKAKVERDSDSLQNDGSLK